MGRSTTASLPAAAWAAIALLTLAGLVLRIAAARGGLWADEAWSAVYAAEARDAVGVFLRINHDNNHHLNSLWLQLVGIGAPPLLARALSIAAGTAAILAAALIGARRGAAQAIAAAALFAAAPILVNYGAEARGYALLVLAILLAVLLVDRWLDNAGEKPPVLRLALLGLFGMLAHLTMIAALAVLAGWAFLALRETEGARPALRRTLRLFAPAVLVAGLVILAVVAAAAASPTGMRLGGYVAFAPDIFFTGLDQVVIYTLGAALRPVWVGPLLAAAATVAIVGLRPDLGQRRFLYLLAILAIPAFVLIVRPGNSQYARYYLVGAIGLLLLAAELIGRGFGAGGWRRPVAAGTLAAILAAALVNDAGLIRIQRGDPDGPLRIIAGRSPAGARVALGEERLAAVLRVAAARTGYRLVLAERCAPADYFLEERAPGAPAPGVAERCGVRLRPLATIEVVSLSGNGWTLYAAEPLQSARPPVSGPPPAG